MSGAVRCVLKRCSLSVPLKASIDKDVKERKLFWRGHMFFAYDSSQSQLDGLEGEMVWLYLLGL